MTITCAINNAGNNTKPEVEILKDVQLCQIDMSLSHVNHIG